METSGKQIMTAKSQIQVINGFFLKETHKLAETIDFLATMTKVITTSLRDLHVIPARYLSRTTYTSLQAELRRTHPRTPFLTSFDAYQALNDKSASRTIGETLARMLLCIRGMSPERVAALLERWDTPRALYDAMAQRASQGVRTEGKRKRRPELFFADEVKGDGRDKIGDALSRDVSFRSFISCVLERELARTENDPGFCADWNSCGGACGATMRSERVRTLATQLQGQVGSGGRNSVNVAEPPSRAGSVAGTL